MLKPCHFQKVIASHLRPAITHPEPCACLGMGWGGGWGGDGGEVQMTSALFLVSDILTAYCSKTHHA